MFISNIFIIEFLFIHKCLFLFCLLLSGIAGGKFLERCRIKKPDQPLNNVTLSEYYKAQDLFIGQIVNFNTHKFILLDADEYAFKYMESHPDEVRHLLIYLEVITTMYL